VRKHCGLYATFSRYGLAGLCLVLAMPPCGQAEPPPMTTNADVLHELRARQALLHDRQLAPLNLGVCVHEHVAVLWGLVPSTALERRAIELLQQLPELIEVRSELHVESSQETAPPAAPLPPLAAPFTLPAPPEPGEESKLKEPPPAARKRPRAPVSSPGILTKQSGTLPKNSPSPVGYPQGSSAETEAPLLPAIAIPQPATATTDDIRSGEWLIEAVTRVQRSEPRFRQIRAEVRGGTVRLDGTVERWSEAYELAERLRQLTGVERVVLGDIHTGP
jgi:hypothetical protein